ncbi:hypothetical protein WA026_015137 [Henosepilachna vigintioctopunctata]|uniref:Uncharacterized protein n=1 Tax=Henosepilachna vigintioctopunctata TaxID=420089 RepID=A0AAW1TT83_9CUCU
MSKGIALEFKQRYNDAAKVRNGGKGVFPDAIVIPADDVCTFAGCVIVSKAKKEDNHGKLLKISEKLSDKSSVNKEKHNNLSKINEKFVLKKLDNKITDAKQWLQSIESECTGFDLNDRSWSCVIYALSFKHLNGSLLEYALKKQRLLLEYNSDIDTRTLTDLIVAGLPTYITSKLDRQEVTDPILLFSALRMYENHNKNVHKHFAEKKSSSKSEVEYKKKPLVEYVTRWERKTDFTLKIRTGSDKTRTVMTV